MTIEFIIDDTKWNDLDFEPVALGIVIFKHVMQMNSKSCSVLLSDDGKLQMLNKTFRSIDKPTNVLSFPSNEQPYIGDIAISICRVLAESKANAKSARNHYAHLLIHGILHLMGYDHETEYEAAVMEEKEVEYLRILDITNPYEEEI